MEITERLIRRIARQEFDLMIKGSNYSRGGAGGGGVIAMYELADVARDGNKVKGATEGKVLRYGSDSKWYAGTLAFGDITGKATAAQVPNIENLTNFSTRVYDAILARAANTVLAGPSSGDAAAATFRALVVADIPSLPISKITGLQSALDSKLDISFFSSLFKAYAGDTEVAPNGGDTSTINNIKAMFGFWTQQYVSARGKGAGGGGGGIGNVTWDALATTATGTHKVDISYLADALTTMTGYTTTDRYYAVQKNSSNHLYVNVPVATWSEITGKPSEFNPASGSNYYMQVVGGMSNINFNLADGSRTSGIYYINKDSYSNQTNTVDGNYGIVVDFNSSAAHLQFGTTTTFNAIYARSYWWTAREGGITYPAWVQLITSGNIGNQTVAAAGKATNDSDGNAINTTYLKKSGGTMTGVLTLQGSQYNGYKTGDGRSYALNANNSDIIGINSLIMSDKSDSWAESIGFPRDGQDAGHYDTIRAANGTFYFGFNGYYDSENVEHAAAELITMTGGTIKLERSDSNDASVTMKNTHGTVSLLTSTNRGVYSNTDSKWLVATDGTNTWMAIGNVGIGTTSPGEKLEVSGNIKAVGYLKSERTIEVAPGQTMTNTVTIGSQSASYTHISASASIPFLFNHDVHVTGEVSPDGNNSYNLGNSNKRWNTAYINYIYGKDSKVGIGTTSPDYALHVNGVIYATTGILTAGYLTGRVASQSDIRTKRVNDYTLPLNLIEIANAPTIRFRWKKGDDQDEHVGSIAQYWQKVMPEVVLKGNDGVLNLEYGTAALVSTITTAREVVALKQRVKDLEDVISKMKYGK